MPRKTTEEKLAGVRNEMAELKNEEKSLVQKHKEEEKTARINRLIKRGAILESLIEGAAEFTNDQIAEILNQTVGSSYGAKVIAKMKSQSEESVTVPQSTGLPKRSNEVDVLGKRSDTETSELFAGEFSDENEQSEVVATTDGGNISAPSAENAETEGL